MISSQSTGIGFSADVIYRNDEYENDEYENDEYENDEYENDEYENDEYANDEYAIDGKLRRGALVSRVTRHVSRFH